jgi:hypothetical protein
MSRRERLGPGGAARDYCYFFSEPACVLPVASGGFESAAIALSNFGSSVLRTAMYFDVT